MRLVFLSAFAVLACCVARAEPETRVVDATPLARWIQRQASITSIQADFVQIRALQALRDPVRTEGKFYFEKPMSFRWQTGEPPKTIVLGKDGEITVIDTRKKEARRISADEMLANPRLRGFDMMEFPIAASYEEFRKRFELRDIEVDGTHCRVEMLPRDAQARKFLSKIQIEFDTDSGHLLAFEVTTREGSSLRSEFSNTRTNVPPDPSVFAFDLSGYEIKDARQ